MLVSVIACFIATFSVLGWIGWRYFVSPKVAPVSAMPRTSRFDAMQLTVSASGGSGCSPKQASWFSASVHGTLLLAFVLVVLSAAGVLASSARISLDPLRAPNLARQEHIQAALNPEGLVPPPPLPPSIFIGTERPGLDTANRDWGRLDPDFVARALKVFARLEARGYPFVLLEGYRSPERQDALADSGAYVTNARAFQSKHQYGMALDAAPLRSGRLVISERDPWAMEAYLALGEEAEAEGLIWGGRWRLRDYGHIEVAGLIGKQARRN